jgi:hypothetical protein
MDIKIMFNIKTYAEYKKSTAVMFSQNNKLSLYRRSTAGLPVFHNRTVNQTGSVRINVTLRSVRVTVVVVENQ